jgi:hypothetical protein
VYLHRIEARLHEALADRQFGNSSVHNCGLALLLQPGDAVYQPARGLEPHFHIGNAMRYGLEPSDRLAKLFPLTGVLDAGFNLALHGPQITG